MITEEVFMWLISGLCMVIVSLLVWILRDIVTSIKDTKTEVIVVREKHDNLRIDHERLSADVQELVTVVRSNEDRDRKRLDVMEKILDERRRK